MSGSGLILSLALAAAVGAPALPPRTDWVGETVFVKKPGGSYERKEADNTYTPVGRLKSIQYVVSRDEKGKLQLTQEGQSIWVNKEDMIRQKDAVAFFTQKLDEEPNDDVWFAFRGWVKHRNGDTAAGLKDYAEAIRLNPAAASWYGNRGLIHLETKNYDDAIADFSSSVELSPTNEVSYRCRGLAYSKKKQWAKSAEDYTAAVELNPASATNLNGLAWVLATAPDDKVRDGKKAVELAKQACDLTENKTGGYLDTLAAAYAEAGDFAKAVEWQEKALKAGGMPIKDLDAAKQRLELFKGKKAYRGE